MPKFINQTEAASFAENAARNEVITANGVTTVYSGTPDVKDPTQADSGSWTICRTIVTKDDQTGATCVETAWAQGSWNDRATLTYKYL